MPLNPFLRRRKAGPPVLSLTCKSGRVVKLTRPLRYGGLRRKDYVPCYWRNIATTLNREIPKVFAKGKNNGEARINGWLLVLAAKKIPHKLFPDGERSRIYVSPVYETLAVNEIRAFEREKPARRFLPPVRQSPGFILLLFLLLIIWHGLRFNWFTFHLPVPPFPLSYAEWPALFGLDIAKVRFGHELWRCLTALTLHSDPSHLFGNVVFGSFFLVPLCRRTGVGFGLFLVILAGMGGNLLNAMFKPELVVSIGFSTALFGALGLLCSFAAMDAIRFHLRSGGTGGNTSVFIFSLAKKAFVYIAAGLALLGFLGGGAEIRTDYAAHIWGFTAGMVLGPLAWLPDVRLRVLAWSKEKYWQVGLGVAALAALVGAWTYAV